MNSQNLNDDPEFIKFIATAETIRTDPNYNKFLNQLKCICNFSPSKDLENMFSEYRKDYIYKMPLYDEASNLFETDSPERKSLDWQSLHRDAIGSCELGFTKLEYHHNNLLSMMKEVLSYYNLHKFTFPDKAGSLSIGSGNYRKMDFEYHGFLDCHRQILHYLTSAIMALIEQDFSSFRKLDNKIKAIYKDQALTPQWLKNILTIQQEYLKISPLLVQINKKGKQDLRDELNHKEYTKLKIYRPFITKRFFF